ncbi:MAG TPA: hypothetical protein VHY34_09005 [Caulobacteraceae bacterium]|jgi:hypothetical protein|nr:hypothetical protein [Caulobacteraceae bacterium]
MSESAHVTSLRRRLIAMIAIDAVCALVAVGAIVGFLSFHVSWMGGLFAVALVAGFGAQIWFFVGFARSRPPG